MMETKKMIIYFKFFSFLLLFLLLSTSVNAINFQGTSSNSNAKEDTLDNILCRNCGADLADAKNIINYLSPEATVIVNQTLFERKGVEVQILKNPLGIEFHAINLKNSKCKAVHNWQQEFSWYPGYTWKPCICKQCGVHHGWLFEPKDTARLSLNFPSKKGFFVLTLSNLLSEKFANSLIIVPKSYLQ